MEALKAAGAAPKWGAALDDAAALVARKNVFPGELRQVGIKAPDKIAVPSVRNDAAFLATVVGALGLSCVCVFLFECTQKKTKQQTHTNNPSENKTTK